MFTFYKSIGHENIWDSGAIDPYVLNLNTMWRLLVSFTPARKSQWYPLDRRLCASQGLF
jgi:hypothetical protein